MCGNGAVDMSYRFYIRRVKGVDLIRLQEFFKSINDQKDETLQISMKRDDNNKRLIEINVQMMDDGINKSRLNLEKLISMQRLITRIQKGVIPTIFYKAKYSLELYNNYINEIIVIKKSNDSQLCTPIEVYNELFKNDIDKSIASGNSSISEGFEVLQEWPSERRLIGIYINKEIIFNSLFQPSDKNEKNDYELIEEDLKEEFNSLCQLKRNKGSKGIDTFESRVLLSSQNMVAKIQKLHQENIEKENDSELMESVLSSSVISKSCLADRNLDYSDLNNEILNANFKKKNFEDIENKLSEVMEQNRDFKKLILENSFKHQEKMDKQQTEFQNEMKIMKESKEKENAEAMQKMDQKNKDENKKMIEANQKKMTEENEKKIEDMLQQQKNQYDQKMKQDAELYNIGLAQNLKQSNKQIEIQQKYYDEQLKQMNSQSNNNIWGGLLGKVIESGTALYGIHKISQYSQPQSNFFQPLFNNRDRDLIHPKFIPILEDGKIFNGNKGKRK